MTTPTKQTRLTYPPLTGVAFARAQAFWPRGWRWPGVDDAWATSVDRIITRANGGTFQCVGATRLHPLSPTFLSAGFTRGYQWDGATRLNPPQPTYLANARRYRTGY